MPDPAPRRWTLSEAQAFIHFNPFYSPRYELVDGEVLVTPTPTPAHQRALGDLLMALASWLETNPVGETLASPFNVQLEPESLVWPDVFILPPDAAARARHTDRASSLILAAEILTPSSEYGDRGPKRRLYQRRVPEYWIVDLEAALVERWRPGDVEPEIIRERLDWMPDGASEPFVIDLRELFNESGASARGSDDPRMDVVRLDTVPRGITSDDPRTFAPVAIENPLRPGERQLLPLARVDPDSPSSWIGAHVLESLRIERGRVRRFERADGTVLERSMGLASLYVKGLRQATTWCSPRWETPSCSAHARSVASISASTR